MAAKWTDFVAGAVLQASQLNSVLDNFQDIAIFNETQANNTDGGTFTSGSYLKRVLNTTVVNNIAGCSIASSVVTLPAGTFYARGVAPQFMTNETRARLQNTTAGTTIQLGTNARSASSDATLTYSVVEGVFTLATSSTIELQHRCVTTRATNGFGTPCNMGDSEVYSSLYIVRIA